MLKQTIHLALAAIIAIESAASAAGAYGGSLDCPGWTPGQLDELTGKLVGSPSVLPCAPIYPDSTRIQDLIQAVAASGGDRLVLYKEFDMIGKAPYRQTFDKYAAEGLNIKSGDGRVKVAGKILEKKFPSHGAILGFFDKTTGIGSAWSVYSTKKRQDGRNYKVFVAEAVDFAENIGNAALRTCLADPTANFDIITNQALFYAGTHATLTQNTLPSDKGMVKIPCSVIPKDRAGARNFFLNMKTGATPGATWNSPDYNSLFIENGKVINYQTSDGDAFLSFYLGQVAGYMDEHRVVKGGAVGIVANDIKTRTWQSGCGKKCTKYEMKRSLVTTTDGYTFEPIRNLLPFAENMASNSIQSCDINVYGILSGYPVTGGKQRYTLREIGDGHRKLVAFYKGNIWLPEDGKREYVSAVYDSMEVKKKGGFNWGGLLVASAIFFATGIPIEFLVADILISANGYQPHAAFWFPSSGGDGPGSLSTLYFNQAATQAVYGTTGGVGAIAAKFDAIPYYARKKPVDRPAVYDAVYYKYESYVPNYLQTGAIVSDSFSAYGTQLAAIMSRNTQGYTHDMMSYTGASATAVGQVGDINYAFYNSGASGASLGYLNVRQDVINAAMLRGEQFFKGVQSWKAGADVYMGDTLGDLE